jgi:hypothetical protein
MPGPSSGPARLSTDTVIASPGYGRDAERPDGASGRRQHVSGEPSDRQWLGNGIVSISRTFMSGAIPEQVQSCSCGLRSSAWPTCNGARSCTTVHLPTPRCRAWPPVRTSPRLRLAVVHRLIAVSKAGRNRYGPEVQRTAAATTAIDEAMPLRHAPLSVIYGPPIAPCRIRRTLAVKAHDPHEALRPIIDG